MDESNAYDIVSFYDIVLDGCDNLKTRYVLNDACKLAGIPFVYSSIYRFEAQLTVLGMQDGPCYRCLFPEPPADVPTCGDAGVLGMLPGIAGCMQATEAVKYIVGFGEVLSGRMLNLDLATHDYDMVSVPCRADCPACAGKFSKVGELPSEAVCGLDLPAPSPAQEVPIVTAHQLRRQISSGKTALVDVRDNFEFMYGHLPSSISIPVSLMRKADADGKYLDRILQQTNGHDIVFYCKSGLRSKNVLVALKKRLDEKNIKASSLDGGVVQWKRENPDFPVL